ncbi:MAG: hypothetical protein Q8N83_10900, partial [Ignavibacteria bacterium]|nr:hypothetical protein [Ignavibacteria bacterium]
EKELKKYPKYKPSGVEWIGEIPQEWEAKRLKYFLTRNDGGVWGDDYDGIQKNATKVFRSTEINIDGSWNFDEEPALRVLLDHEKEKALLKEGDLLVTKSSGSQLHIGKTALVTKRIEEQNCCYSNFMQRLRPFNIEASKFLHIFLNSNLARDQYNYLSNSTTGLANLSAGLLNDILLPCQRTEEQTAIANFLDEKTVKIDTLIEKKKKLIELLKEERTAVINQAVTRGINPKVKLKESGIDWLGLIPEHWEVKKVGYLSYITKLTGFEYTQKWETSNDGEIIAIRGYNIREGFLDISKVERISQKLSNELIRSKLFKNDIVYPCTGTIGNAVLIRENDKYHINQNIAKITPKKLIHPRFLLWSLLSFGVKSQIHFNNVSQMQPVILIGELRQIKITCPKNIHEQLQIVQHIETETKRIDGTITKTEKEIELLAEYRTALISEVVTGKIDVSNKV